jgi:hypothetical protein
LHKIKSRDFFLTHLGQKIAETSQGPLQNLDMMSSDSQPRAHEIKTKGYEKI